MKKAKHITINRREKCVMARIQRERVQYAENFSFKEYGGVNKAKVAAKAWVVDQLQVLPPPVPEKNRMTVRNRSGVVGVRLAHDFRNSARQQYEAWRWVAHWPGCARRGGLSWACEKYGDDQAFVLAYLTRRAETLDRDAVIAVLTEIRRKKEYQRILALKRIEPD